MTEPTTVDATMDTTEDAGPPVWTAPPDVPSGADVPREGAANTAAMAAALLATVLDYREAVRPALEADPPAVDRAALEQVADFRRRVAVVADLITRRALSVNGTVAAQHALRLAERVAGLTDRACRGADPELSRYAAADILGRSKVYRCRQMSKSDDATFDAAVEVCRDKGAATFDAMLAAIDADGLPAAAKEQRAVMARLAAAGNSTRQIGDALGITAERAAELAGRYGIEVPADAVAERPAVADPGRVVQEVADLTEAVAAVARLLDRSDVAALDPDACADWSQQLWGSAKWVLLLRKMLDEHATGKV